MSDGNHNCGRKAISPEAYGRIVRDKRISDGAFRLWHLLHNMTGSNPCCWPGQRHIREVLGGSTNSIGRWIEQLKRFGYLRTEELSREKHPFIPRKTKRDGVVYYILLGVTESSNASSVTETDNTSASGVTGFDNQPFSEPVTAGVTGSSNEINSSKSNKGTKAFKCVNFENDLMQRAAEVCGPEAMASSGGLIRTLIRENAQVFESALGDVKAMKIEGRIQTTPIAALVDTFKRFKNFSRPRTDKNEGTRNDGKSSQYAGVGRAHAAEANQRYEHIPARKMFADEPPVQAAPKATPTAQVSSFDVSALIAQARSDVDAAPEPPTRQRKPRP